ncbi:MULTISPECIES: hypothetical protein [Flavobacteriaceae]|uniref:Uncharacterized protein n=2 Tax=Flavobacteriaceae TaxID=49546 RepID=A0A4Y8AUR2_9FLAO|nr:MULTISPECIES: hypothetical protein [Flavobacteriaceae]TEW76283.1 hypothetical protein E2488_00055 [Gramella jeungdoensis]GGK59748.1 hypothetical protein GCM10007963_29870 [Lutibacter litoralis]
MRTKTNLIATLVFALMVTTFTVNAQEEKESYAMVEVTYMKAKIGMEKAFEAAVKSHNEKYHKEGVFKASLDLIITGKETGWYAWIMGPCTFSDLDKRPNDSAHGNDWDKNVSPNVLEYGRNEFWRYNSKLSYSGNSPDSPKLENIWFIDLKKGQGYKFREFIEKVKKAHEKRGEGSLNVYNNQFRDDEGRDVAIVWGYNNWAEMDDDNGGIKKYYEEIYGEGSWTNALKDWDNSIDSINSQVWRIGVNK